ncbi:MAG: hypothetical protein HLUCCO16_11505 [Phormidium sp. OSCR]|jgi:hypothetical protein|nr:MAG: hypothetical protein HLUCCO16_11505 [Phormidium sp. OSCR]
MSYNYCLGLNERPKPALLALILFLSRSLDPMDRSKVVAIVTGAISLLLAIAYLVLVQFLDFRGEMLPAPQDLSTLMSWYG